MNKLERWKQRLEKAGVKAKLGRGGSALTVTELNGPYSRVTLFHDYDDHSAAEFISRLAARLHGEWAYYAPEDLDDDGFSDSWALCVFDEVKGSGPTKLEALFNSMEDK